MVLWLFSMLLFVIMVISVRLISMFNYWFFLILFGIIYFNICNLCRKVNIEIIIFF